MIWYVVTLLTDLKGECVYQGGVVPLDVAMFILLFLDCGSQYITKENSAQLGE